MKQVGILAVGIVLALLGPDLIGSGLSDGLSLVYESDGRSQQPWVYDSVRVATSRTFDHCIIVSRRGQPIRETCSRRDTLFVRDDARVYHPLRPIGEGMTLEVPGRNGHVLTYTTTTVGATQIGDRSVKYVTTTIITRDSAGAAIRRLREQFAPSLLTAVWGVFEVPDENGGWRTASEFVLRVIQEDGL